MTHEFDGQKYELASAHQKEWGTMLIAELDLQGSERVLDLGCGAGALTSRIADLVPRGHVTGIDSSQGMIESTKTTEGSFAVNQLWTSRALNTKFSIAVIHGDHAYGLDNGVLACIDLADGRHK